MNHVLTERIPATSEGFADVFQVTLGEKTTHSHGYFFPGSLCTDGEKGGQHLRKGGQLAPQAPAFHRGPGDAGGRTGGCGGSRWDKAGSREARRDGRLLLIYQGDKLEREATLEDSTFYPPFLAGFSPVPDQKGIFLLQEAEVESVKQDLNINAHSLESGGILTGLHPLL